MESFWDKLLSGSEAILEPLHVPLRPAAVRSTRSIFSNTDLRVHGRYVAVFFSIGEENRREDALTDMLNIVSRLNGQIAAQAEDAADRTVEFQSRVKRNAAAL